MKRDPHESSRRVETFQTDAADEALFDAVNRALAAAPLPPSPPRQAAADLPVIYVIGAPRSGTTLLSQMLSRYFDVGYIDNVIARFWMRPSVGIRLSNVVLGPDRRSTIAFTSRFGSTLQPAGPHEFGYFWRRWLNLDASPTHHLDAAALRSLDMNGFRNELYSEILEPFGTATVFKNVICGFQAEWLTRAHSRSLFIHIKRPLESTVRSILHARLTRYGTYHAWWSLKPSAFERIAALPDPVGQVVEQVRACVDEFDAELARPGVASLQLEYGDVCHDPAGALALVANAVDRFGPPLTPIAAPQPFAVSNGPDLPADMAARLQHLIGGAETKARTS